MNYLHTEQFYETVTGGDSNCLFVQLMVSAGQVQTKVCYQVNQLSNQVSQLKHHLIVHVGCKLLNLEKVPVLLIINFHTVALFT